MLFYICKCLRLLWLTIAVLEHYSVLLTAQGGEILVFSAPLINYKQVIKGALFYSLLAWVKSSGTWLILTSTVSPFFKIYTWESLSVILDVYLWHSPSVNLTIIVQVKSCLLKPIPTIFDVLMIHMLQQLSESHNEEVSTLAKDLHRLQADLNKKDFELQVSSGGNWLLWP